MSTFQFIEQLALPHIDASVSLFRHAASGAEHVHLATQEPELAFLVGFPTVPMASDGRAHILEHLVLCGSQRFPVRDPFFMMMRRSVATFMNAMTYPDRTVYPFSTTDPADFRNLLEVYLDATFFPTLDRLSFLQEGWRIELERPDGGAASYQGVVLNEMKGVSSNPADVARSGIMAALLDGTTYAYNSGGDPLQIPSLDHDALREFHRRHYHPSQALFMTAGPLDPNDVQRTLEQRVLSRLPAAPRPRLQPQLADAWTAPRHIVVPVPAQGEGAAAHGLQLAWRLHDSADVDRTLQLRLLVSLLIGHAGAPVRQAVETAGFGHAGSLLGLDDSPRQIVLHLGMGGLREAQVPAAREVFMNVLSQLAETGLPQAAVEAGLRELQFGVRQDVNGLNRLIDASQALLRQQSLAGVFGMTEALARLEAVALQPGFVQRAMRELLACPAHLSAHLSPSTSYFSERERAEQLALSRRVDGLDVAAREQILRDNAALAAQQGRPDDADCLPRLRVADLASEPRALPSWTPGPAIAHGMAAQGLSHLQLCVDLSAVPAADWPWMHLYAHLLAGLGAGGRRWEDALRWRHEQVPTFEVSLVAPAPLRGPQRLTLALSCSMLRERQQAAVDVLEAWLIRPALDDDARVAQLLRSGIQARITSLPFGAGAFAQLELTEALSPTGAFRHAVEGLPSLDFLEELRQLLSHDDGAGQVCAQLRRMHQRVLEGARQAISGADAADSAALLQEAAQRLGPFRDGDAALAPRRHQPQQLHRAFHSGTGINACTMGWAVPTLDHADAPALAVAAELLVQQQLHTRVRERGGAYGAGAGYTPVPGLFFMKSDSDPRLAETFRDFEESLHEVSHSAASGDALEQAVISAIKRLDPPASPVADMFHRWYLLRGGIRDEDRAAYRRGILACTPQQVQRAVATWLPVDGASRVAVAGHLGQDLAGLDVTDLTEIARELAARAG
ncbi:insulinase family protein [Roseateles cellulosilyticus]|uniref:Insulinase family protein n=1 Tax=Pelomonas cellulosilytica TaxID=2906762 RepID=A0ABS8Y3V2_9BURK|nr:insulinase family protein [Pelomonas sp. P8]MCE4557952.1 insulinase family protein [Pelomonas sp. P8]